MENQEDRVCYVKLWDLVARDLKEKKSNKAKEDENKLIKNERVLAPVIVNQPIAVPVVEASLIKPSVVSQKSPKLQKRRKEEKDLAPVIVTKLVDVPLVEAKPAAKPEKTKIQTEWTTIIRNLIRTNTIKELTSSLQKLSTAENIPHVKKWHEIEKAKFEVCNCQKFNIICL